jgi:hypothetical protein
MNEDSVRRHTEFVARLGHHGHGLAAYRMGWSSGYRVMIRLSRFKLCYWSLLEAPVCAYSVSFSWEKRLWCM